MTPPERPSPVRPRGSLRGARMLHRVVARAAIWIGLYLACALVPAAVVVLRAPSPGRGFWVELGAILGLIGFAMLAIQFATTARFRWLAPFFGADTMVQFHRQAGILGFGLVLAHPIVLFLADARFLEYLDPRINLLRALFLAGAMVGLVLLVVLPLWRLSLGLSYEWWRVTHGVLAAGVMVVGLAHALQVGHYVAGVGPQALWAVVTGAGLGLLAHTRLVKPWQLRQRPYRVAQVRPERDSSWTLALEPAGHEGLTFRAGQFAWLTLGETPLALQQHPFSFSSSARDRRRVELTIKELGDFTGSVKEVAPGTRAYLEGPYGAFTLPARAAGAVMVMGGIGITPAMSILRTLRDDRDRRRIVLFYANRNWEDVTFREELESLQQQLDLKVIHVLEEAPPGWEGEAGYVTADVLARHLDGERDDVFYFVCGPEPMMDAVEQALLARGVPPWRLLSERFNLV